MIHRPPLFITVDPFTFYIVRIIKKRHKFCRKNIDLKFDNFASKYQLEKGFMLSIQAPKALDDSLDHYYIISQSIDAGTEVPVGTHITLEKGAVKVGAQVTVPNLLLPQ